MGPDHVFPLIQHKKNLKILSSQDIGREMLLKYYSNSDDLFSQADILLELVHNFTATR